MFYILDTNSEEKHLIREWTLQHNVSNKTKKNEANNRVKVNNKPYEETLLHDRVSKFVNTYW